MTIPTFVRTETDGDIGILIIDNPPVNAINPDLAAQAIEALFRFDRDPAIAAMVLVGHGRTFIAGADIRQFSKDRKVPAIGERGSDQLDQTAKPVVAAIHGYALGGGLEWALACHYRIATESAKVGLPEVLIGILAGGGGTQRLTRLIGPEAALDVTLTGRHVPAREALALGILDAVIEDKEDLRAAAVAFARRVAAIRPLPRVRDRDDRMAEGTPALFDETRARIARKARNQKAPYNNILAVAAACRLPFDEGLIEERRLFSELEGTEEAYGLRYAFFAEREAGKLPDLPKDLAVPPIATAAIVGAGTMGGGIAMCFADAGIPVRLMDATPEALQRGMARIAGNYAISVARGSVSQAEVDKRLPLIQAVSSHDEIADCDVVVEAVFEDIPLKQQLFRQLDAVMKPGALLLSNTSAISIDVIADATKRPGDVAGAHFFSPANVMKLLEVVRGSATSPAALAATAKLGRSIGKVSVVVKNCEGFLTSRSRAPFLSEMVILLEEGALPEQIDRVMVEFGYPMGPFAAGDLAGLEIGYAWRARRAAKDPAYRKLPIADRVVEMGRCGQKTGGGWYRYEPGDRTPHPDPVVTALIEQVSAELGVTRRAIGDEEILHRMLFGAVNESCRIIEEGLVYRASDIDVAWVNGFAFPRYRGGLMYWADTVGVAGIAAQVKAWHQALGPRWAPAALLLRAAEEGLQLRGLTANL